MRTPTTFLPCKSFQFFCLPVSWRSGLCQSCSRLLGSRFLSPRLPPHQVGSIQLKIDMKFCFYQARFQNTLWPLVHGRRPPNPHHGGWSKSSLHHPWLWLPWPGMVTEYLQVCQFSIKDSASLGAIGYYTSDLLVDRMSDILSEHVGLEKGFFFSGYPEGRFWKHYHFLTLAPFLH